MFKVRLETVVEIDVLVEAESVEEAEERAFDSVHAEEYADGSIGFTAYDGVEIERTCAPNYIDVVDTEEVKNAD